MKNFRIMYLRDHNKHPVGCLAFKIDPKANAIEYQLSTLNPQDSFNRRVARELALGRMVSNPISLWLLNDDTMHSITRAIMLNIVKQQGLPTRTRKAAKIWINKHCDK